MHDLVIKNALICDGLGNPARHGALAVDGDRIAAVGDDIGSARETVDGDGLVLAPGIIDMHTHYDAQLTWDPYATPSTGLGVTTVVIGNCGFTIAPCKAAHHDITMRNLTHVEGMSLDAMRAGIVWDFETYPEYLDAMVRRGIVPNVAAFVGHSSVRTYVLGEAAAQRPATRGEVAEMRRLVVEAIEAGAVGFATSTLEQHNGENGVPMPSRLADDHEMAELTGALGETGRGLFMLTKGNISTIPYLEGIAADTGRPVVIAAMFLDPSDPERVFNMMGEISAAQARGRELYGQVGCFPLAMDFTMRHPYPFEAFVSWRPAMEAPDVAAYKAVLADGGFRQALKDEAKVAGVQNRFSNQWDQLDIVEVARPENRGLEGTTIADLARAEGKHPFDAFLDFGLAEDLATRFTVRILNADEDKVLGLLKHPHAALALSDAGAHLSFLCDAGYGLHLLGHWVRERGDFTLEEAVRMITSRAAEIFRIKDRGRLVVGAHADLMLFDPNTVARGPKRRVHDLPTGAARLDTPAVGLHGVWINGRRTVGPDGIAADCGRPGRVLRDFAD